MQALRHLYQQLVANRVAHGFVDRLKVIQANEQDPDRPGGFIKQDRQVALEYQVMWQAGNRVMTDGMGQIHVRLFLLGNVAPGRIDQPILCGAGRPLEPAIAAVATQELDDEFAQLTAFTVHAGGGQCCRVAVIGMHEFLEMPGRHLLGAEAGKLAQRTIDLGKSPCLRIENAEQLH